MGEGCEKKQMTIRLPVDAKELAAALERLPEEEKLKIFYMIMGIELVRLDKVTA